MTKMINFIRGVCRIMKIIHNGVVQNTYVVWKYHQQNFGFFDRELPILCKSCAQRSPCLWATLNFCQPFDELLHFFVESDIAFGELFDDFFIYQVWCYKMKNKKEPKMLLKLHIYVHCICLWYWIFFPRHKTLRTASNKLVINLAFSNAIMHIKSWVIIVNGLHGGPILGDFGKAYYI